MARNRVPAVEGWFTLDAAAPALLGTRCKACGTYFFPREEFSCRNPRCGASDFEETPLSTRGKLWSFTDNRYPPPKPYMARGSVRAVRGRRGRARAREDGRARPGRRRASAATSSPLGMEMELVLDTLYEDDANEYVIWKWRPCDAR